MMCSVIRRYGIFSHKFSVLCHLTGALVVVGEWFHIGFPKFRGYLCGDPYNCKKDYLLLWFILGSPTSGNSIY